jgi:hypothetical protein
VHLFASDETAEIADELPRKQAASRGGSRRPDREVNGIDLSLTARVEFALLPRFGERFLEVVAMEIQIAVFGDVEFDVVVDATRLL